MSPAERLIYMANQIARNFEAQGPATAAQATADHIALFWDPRMRAHILEILAAGGDGLSPLAAEAVRLLHARQGAARAG
ncbi:MAG: formate dehydrogenase subunit delta [Proteobacteria bacterium]|nr:formate dehydrogenase subunit delta [Pseudomonadota bacterium]